MRSKLVGLVGLITVAALAVIVGLGGTAQGTAGSAHRQGEVVTVADIQMGPRIVG